MHEEFLANIYSHLQDLSHRLVYTDWLEERGNVRGEFIREHIEAGGQSLNARCQKLLLTQPEQVVGEGAIFDMGWIFENGLITAVEPPGLFQAEEEERYLRFHRDLKCQEVRAPFQVNQVQRYVQDGYRLHRHGDRQQRLHVDSAAESLHDWYETQARLIAHGQYRIRQTGDAVAISFRAISDAGWVDYSGQFIGERLELQWRSHKNGKTGVDVFHLVRFEDVPVAPHTFPPHLWRQAQNLSGIEALLADEDEHRRNFPSSEPGGFGFRDDFNEPGVIREIVEDDET